MSPTEIIAIVALTGWAIYKQTQIAEVHEKGRFKMAVIYAIVGLCVGGYAYPEGGTAWGLLALSIVLSVVVGVARGYLTRVWVQHDGVVVRQGTVLTVSLFLGLIVAKFGIGTYAYLEHVKDGAGFGEIMIMIAVMIVVQAEIVWRRAQELSPALAGRAEAVEVPTR